MLATTEGAVAELTLVLLLRSAPRLAGRRRRRCRHRHGGGGGHSGTEKETVLRRGLRRTAGIWRDRLWAGSELADY
jgi:hypothetical protein